MGFSAGIEKGEARAPFGIKVGVGIGTAALLELLDDFAFHVDQIVELDFLVVGQPHSALIGIGTAEFELRIADGSQQQPLDRAAVGKQDFDLAVDRMIFGRTLGRRRWSR